MGAFKGQALMLHWQDWGLFLHNVCVWGGCGGAGGDMGETVVALLVVLPPRVTLNKEVPKTVTEPCNVPGTGQV